MVADISAVLDHAQTVVIGNDDPDFRNLPQTLRNDQVLMDFVRITDRRSEKENMTASLGERLGVEAPRRV